LPRSIVRPQRSPAEEIPGGMVGRRQRVVLPSHPSFA